MSTVTVKKDASVPAKFVHRRATSYDVLVGQKVRTRRLECKLSQTELASQIGITFQQVQKYEKGVNRIGAGRLQRIADALEVVPAYFFEGKPQPHEIVGRAHSNSRTIFDKLQSKDAVRLVDAFHKVRGKQTRLLFMQLAEAIVREQGN